MDEKTAKELIPKMIHFLQKYRSNGAIMIGDGETERKVLADLEPYIFGDKCPLSIMVRMDENQKIEPQQFYNICFLFHRKMEAVVVWASMISGIEIPEPDISWVADPDWFGEAPRREIDNFKAANMWEQED